MSRVWEPTPVEKMTHAEALRLAREHLPPVTSSWTYKLWVDGQSGHYTPQGPAVQVGGYVGKQLRKIKHDQIGVWWSHDPEERLYVFDIRTLWNERDSGMKQGVMDL